MSVASPMGSNGPGMAQIYQTMVSANPSANYTTTQDMAKKLMGLYIAVARNAADPLNNPIPKEYAPLLSALGYMPNKQLTMGYSANDYHRKDPLKDLMSGLYC